MRKVVVFDIDDTLHKEIEYMKSAYRLIAKELWDDKWYEHYTQMLADYHAGVNVFEKICAQRADVELAGLLNMYRFGVHELTLDDEVVEVLSSLKAKGVILGIVSDGREVTQMNKVEALGLIRWIDADCIVINSDSKLFKPNPSGYERLVAAIRAKYGDELFEYTYVGDNLKKDFIVPNALGWNTICLKDDGRNIHKQDFDAASGDAMPKKVIASLRELVTKFGEPSIELFALS